MEMKPITAAPNEGTVTASDYDGFIALLNDRRKKLGLPMTAINDLAGLPGGYANKILLGTHRKGPYNAIGPGTLDKLLAAFGVGIQIVLAPLSIDGSGGKIGSYTQVLSARGRRGAAERMRKTTPTQRREWARKAAKARWKRK